MSGILSSIWTSAVPALDTGLAASGFFLAAALLLDALDMTLPSTDTTGGAGALCAAALIVLGPAPALLVALASAAAAYFAVGRKTPNARLVDVIASRALGLLAGAVMLYSLAPYRLTAITTMVVPAAFLLVESIVPRVLAGWRARTRVRMFGDNAGSEAALIVAQWSASVLLLITYPGMQAWSLVPAVALLLLMRQSYALLLNIRETYRTTVEVLVEAAESQDIRRAGHSDRTAAVARAIAADCGLSSREVDRIGYAALLHDLGRLAEQAISEGQEVSPHTRASSADIVQGVEFFKTIEPILRVCEGDVEDAAEEADLIAGLVVALASDIDAEYHPFVAAAHDDGALGRVAQIVSPATKARVVGAALRLGYRIPAVS